MFLTLLSGQTPHKHSHDRVIPFPDVPGYETLICDLHMHTVFSDGNVWPIVRVDEAMRDGLDVIAITEHLEYQPQNRIYPTLIGTGHMLLPANGPKGMISSFSTAQR